VSRACYDTTVLIDGLRGVPRVLKLLREHEGWEQATTAINAYELALGSTTGDRRSAALDLLETLEIFPLDSDVAWRAGESMRILRKQGREAPLRDLLVGTIAREAGYPLFSCDRKFPPLEGLQLIIV